jgi:hypothetical protein
MKVGSIFRIWKTTAQWRCCIVYILLTSYSNLLTRLMCGVSTDTSPYQTSDWCENILLQTGESRSTYIKYAANSWFIVNKSSLKIAFRKQRPSLVAAMWNQRSRNSTDGLGVILHLLMSPPPLVVQNIWRRIRVRLLTSNYASQMATFALMSRNHRTWRNSVFWSAFGGFRFEFQGRNTMFYKFM